MTTPTMTQAIAECDAMLIVDLLDDERETITTELNHEIAEGRGGRALHEDTVPPLVKAGVLAKGPRNTIELTARGLRIARKLAA